MFAVSLLVRRGEPDEFWMILCAVMRCSVFVHWLYDGSV